MYNPYYPFQNREVSVQVEKAVPRKKAAIELFRTLSGFMAAFLIILMSAFALRFTEIQLSKSFTNNAIAAPAIEKTINEDKKCSVKENLEKVYLRVAGVFNKDNFNKLLGIKTAQAASSYESMRLIQSAETLNLGSGERELFIVGFKNTGTKTWTRDGSRFVSVYTYSPKYRKSAFEDSDWYDSVQPAKLKNETVRPGEIGYVEFFLTAPSEPGEYVETFRLATEDTAWMVGGEFSVKINVVEKATLEATKLIQSHREMTFKRGEVQEFRIGFKNTGITEWKERSIARADLQAATVSDHTMMFMDSSWVDTIRPVVLNGGAVSSGQLGFLTFKLRAPQTSGNYTLHFSLAANGEYVDGGDFSIPVTVTDESVGAAPNANPVSIMTLGPEPNMRIGLFYYNTAEHEPVRVVANTDYEVRNANGGLLTNLPPRVQATLNFDFNTNLYTIEVSGSTYTSAEHLRLIPLNPGTFQITSFENRPSWNRTLNDNVFRGIMEYRFSEQTGRLWIINDLPMESYIKGLAESMSTDPLQYQKALAVAARTYAYYHYANGGKHPRQNLTLNASEGDQVYRGYNSELRLPKLDQAVNETKGQVITYGGKVVVTPYFAKSNGYTRTWTQAWGGASKPWLPSVLCPYDKANGRTRHGHGVGMSMWDARDRARNGQDYLTILRSYYIGTQTSQIYQ